MKQSIIETHPVSTTGRLFKVARLRDEYHDWVQDPAEFANALASQRVADAFTFLQPITDRVPHHGYHLEWEHAAVLQLSTFEDWWKRQINDKTRNMIRKAQKSGVILRDVPFSDELVRGIMRIYNETPIRQGRRFRHFGKSIETIREEHATFLDRSDFVGAYHGESLIGFMKLVHGDGVSHIMNIVSLLSERNKAPTNALIAKAVERCVERGVTLLHYGSWSRRSMGEFKKHHAFQSMAIPRYYVPLTAKGRIGLQLRLHRSLREMLPAIWVDNLAEWRGRYQSYRTPKMNLSGQ